MSPGRRPLKPRNQRNWTFPACGADRGNGSGAGRCLGGLRLFFLGQRHQCDGRRKHVFDFSSLGPVVRIQQRLCAVTDAANPVQERPVRFRADLLEKRIDFDHIVAEGVGESPELFQRR